MHYRVYALNASGGIMKAQDLMASSDAEAIRSAMHVYPNQPFELWCGTRRVSTSRELQRPA